jgi:hypothetical protein
MAIEPLPGDHLRLGCDTPECTSEIVAHGVTEGDLLDRAEERGWSIARDFGLHYCPLTQVHECHDCGAPTRESITHVATGETTYYCAAHWPL